MKTQSRELYTHEKYESVIIRMAYELQRKLEYSATVQKPTSVTTQVEPLKISVITKIDNPKHRNKNSILYIIYKYLCK